MREPGLFRERFRCTETLCLCSRTYCCYDVTSNKLKFSSKGLNKRVLEHSGDGPLEKYRRVLNEKVNVISNNRGFRTNNHSVATYEQVKKSLSYFHPKRIVETMEFALSHLICKTFTHFLFYNVMYLFNFIRSNQLFKTLKYSARYNQAKRNCSSLKNVCKCAETPPTLSTDTSTEWILYLSWSIQFMTSLDQK